MRFFKNLFKTAECIITISVLCKHNSQNKTGFSIYVCAVIGPCSEGYTDEKLFFHMGTCKPSSNISTLWWHIQFKKKKYCLAHSANYTPCPGAFLDHDPAELDSPTRIVNYTPVDVQEWDYRAPGRQLLLRCE